MTSNLIFLFICVFFTLFFILKSKKKNNTQVKPEQENTKHDNLDAGCLWKHKGFNTEQRRTLTIYFLSPGLLLVPLVLRVGVVPAHGPLRQLLEVVCGSWLTLPVGEDCGHRCLPDRRPLHRWGEPATVQGETSGHPAHPGLVDFMNKHKWWLL